MLEAAAYRHSTVYCSKYIVMPFRSDWLLWKFDSYFCRKVILRHTNVIHEHVTIILMFCRGTQTMDNNRICHWLLFHEHGKQNFGSHFSGQGSYYDYTLGLNFTIKSRAESLVIMHGPYLKLTQLLCVVWQYRLWAASPCLSWSSSLHQIDNCALLLARVQIWNVGIRSFNLYSGIWPCTKKKHIDASYNAVPFSVGLRLVPINCEYARWISV